MLSIKETAELLGMGESTLSKKLHLFSVNGIVKENKRVWISLSSLPELKNALNYNEEFDKGTFYSTAEVTQKFNEKGLKVKRNDVSNWIQKGKVKTIQHMGYRYIHENDLDHFIENTINERAIPKGFCTLEEAGNILERHPQTIRQWAMEGEIEYKHIIVDNYWRTIVNKDSLQNVKMKKRINMLKNFAHVDIEAISEKVEIKKNNKRNKQGDIASLPLGQSLEAKDAAKLLGIKNNSLYAFLKKGKFPSAFKIKNKWYIPEGDITSYKNRRDSSGSDSSLDGYLTIPEITKRSNLSKSWITIQINKGIFPNAKKINGKWFIPEEDFLHYTEVKQKKKELQEKKKNEHMNKILLKKNEKEIQKKELPPLSYKGTTIARSYIDIKSSENPKIKPI
ncbi:helix-turn-helix domain-containing protein [Bacillus timonensis]|uniref:helix-turn-helix domain-containing protein n=1 Tax=Bacillus timonensis TaxID=1033734 RepID=UPI0002E4627E|nr:helix-turn-helix domain-containing protein [Bacillus timonensis]